MTAHNNYFRVQGTTDCFTFHDSDALSLERALAGAQERASYHRAARLPAVLVWRRTSHPGVRSLAQVGEIYSPIS